MTVFRAATLGTFFFAFHAGAKELRRPTAISNQPTWSRGSKHHVEATVDGRSQWCLVESNIQLGLYSLLLWTEVVYFFAAQRTTAHLYDYCVNEREAQPMNCL